MQIFATFEYSAFLELAVSELKRKGVSGIYAVPLDLRRESPRLMDSLHHADGMSFLDKGLILAFLLGTIGASKGFVWEWGPVIWGLIGALTGFLLGVLISCLQYLASRRRHRGRIRKGKRGDVILIVTCEAAQAEWVEGVLWEHKALGLAKTR